MNTFKRKALADAFPAPEPSPGSRGAGSMTNARDFTAEVKGILWNSL